MTVARALGIALHGVTGQAVEVQADLSAGLPGLAFTGLPDASVVEARDRIRAAVLNTCGQWPNRRITVALLPADVRKVGSRFDLAIAVAILAVAQEIPAGTVSRTAWIAELGLDGRLRPVRGVLPALLAARQAGVRSVVVAADDQAEAALVGGIEVRCAQDLAEVIAAARGQTPLPPPMAARAEDVRASDLDLIDVAGQSPAKRALEISAAGGHHLHLTGPPGAGKTMLARRLPGLLPVLDEAAALEVTAVHSVAGTLPRAATLLRRPPFQAPHHTASIAALVGGGSGLALPGAISLAHRGVLFLDEAPEFHPRALDGLREPLETGEISLHRIGGTVTYPCRFLLVLAGNPCPCGQPARECACLPQARRRHAARLSGPLRDRIDLRVWRDPVPTTHLLGPSGVGEPTSVVSRRVVAARAAAAERWRPAGAQTNGDVAGGVLRRPPWALGATAVEPALRFLERGQLSARGLDRVLRVAWTLADLGGRTSPGAPEVAEAVYFRGHGGQGVWAA